MLHSPAVLSLNIETSTTLCSVSIGQNDTCLDFIEIDDGAYHSENLHQFIKQLLQRNSIQIQNINFISISNGPGSYTGLRIGAASAKTMAYALNIPLISISSLLTQTWMFLSKKECSTRYIASTMAARGHKIYLALYSNKGEEIISPQGFTADEKNIQAIVEKCANDIVFIGTGTSMISNTKYISNEPIVPSSQFMIRSAFDKFQKQHFENPVYFEPLYI